MSSVLPIGAATIEAQENVALQIAEQMSNYLLEGAVENALNMPSMSAEEAKLWGLGLNYHNTWEVLLAR